MKTLTLKTPVKHGSEVITVLEVREPKAKHLRELPVGGEQRYGHMLDLASKVTGQPKSVIDELSVEDVRNVLEIIGGFLSVGQETGTAS